MRSIHRRVWQYTYIYVCLGIVAGAVVQPVVAQQPRSPQSRTQQSRLAPAAIGQIVSEVLRVLVPPGQSLSRVSVANRKVFFDLDRTMAAFGYPGASTSLAELGIRRPVTVGTESLLSDCDHWGEKPCKHLGWSAYVWIEPLSITDSQAVVRSYVSWPDRGHTPFVEGVDPTSVPFPTSIAMLTGFAAEIYLARSANGEWKFVKRGVSIVGE